ncbi:rhamnogalacturonan acetylesterase [Pelosinus propionicus]|nr:rhamnogalacturonan acetylesterase [Pelosinus propionicus]
MAFASEKSKEKVPISIFLAGDSTVCNYKSERAPRAGWGQVIDRYFSKEVTIKNYATSGRSTKSFIDEGRLDTILSEIKAKDYLLIQFGHNDEKKDVLSLYTEPSTTYKEYLKQYINGARKHGAIPILITPVERRNFDTNGKIIASHGKYPDAMKEVGAAENVLVIDLSTASRNYIASLGPEKSKIIFMQLQAGDSYNYPQGSNDNTHFQEKGAIEIAKLIIEEMLKTDCDLKRYINKPMLK